MITCGIDCGAKTTKVVIFEDEILAKSVVLSGFDQEASAKKAFDNALKIAHISPDNVSRIVSTGVGRKAISFSNNNVTEVGADAKGINFLFPKAKTGIDVGAEEGRAIKCNGGKVLDFAINEKCAAGAGTFCEAMARALDVSLEEFGRISLESTKEIPMNAQCTIFAESEVVSLIHQKIPKSDIARAVHDAIASRITSMARRVGIEEDVVLIGGVAKNVGFVESLKRDFGVEILISEDPEFVGALGASLIAREGF